MGLGAGASDEGKVASDFEAAHLSDFERAEFEFFRDGPARNESDAESGFDGGFDGFGGIEVHYGFEGLEFESGFFERGFDDMARA